MCSAVLLCIMWKTHHFTVFILSLLTNSLHSEPMRHAQASLKEGLNNMSIPFSFINAPIFFFTFSFPLSFILVLSLEGVTSYTGIWFTNTCWLHTKIQMTESRAVLQRHTLPRWYHLLVSLVLNFGTSVSFWALEWRWPVFRRCLPPITSRGELQALGAHKRTLLCKASAWLWALKY